MNVTMQVVPVPDQRDGKVGDELSYQLSIADTNGGGTASSQFRTLDDLIDALKDIGLDSTAIRFAEKTLKGGLSYTRPGVELKDSDLRKLGFEPMKRQIESQIERQRGGRER